MYASSFSKSNTLLLPFPEFETSWRDLVDSSLQQKSNQKHNEQKQIFDNSCLLLAPKLDLQRLNSTFTIN
jgi:hypothetical protein